jgi:acyl carrier protein|tara:strand:- start:83 stop:334 length:252 start_codon:yes stop_codon:yes gene_type:complete
MSVEPKAVVDLICDLLQPFNGDGVNITKDTDLTSDLHIDSVAVMDLLMEIEDTYNIFIPINRLADMRTVNDLASTVHETIGNT